jgi:hypothetical protein
MTHTAKRRDHILRGLQRRAYYKMYHVFSFLVAIGFGYCITVGLIVILMLIVNRDI